MKKDLVVLSTVALVLFLGPLTTRSAQSTSDDCSCGPPKNGETTHWVGNETVVFVEKGSYRTLRGTVTYGYASPLGEALVEVFTVPKRSEGRRVAACRTGRDGKFCFVGLPSGKHELRSSSDDSLTGWNVTKIFVVVHRKTGKHKDLEIKMKLGT